MPCTFNIPITLTPSGSRGGLRHCPDREFDSEPIASANEKEKSTHGNEGYNLTKKKREAGMGLKGFRD